ncbi:hypothetical protein BESB_000060 [Besnoitia besnoiti]|uniref:Uncharacterized protein n=1 Tax=Besnoitia besnoiti TaxID=94643 RepID=A0A2A9MKC9_BESBE|nr:hypothetical protein BESB_000060 [Besnoitia besnoiti]PFH37664.1 hypothetical protein BESB_000060 [Besnoitia besnoiti]
METAPPAASLSSPLSADFACGAGETRARRPASLVSLSDFSRLVGISHFVAGDPADCGASAAAEGEGARRLQAPQKGLAAEETEWRPVAPSEATCAGEGFRGSLKTLFEDFQVYEHSEFPCVCLAAERLCPRCQSGVEDPRRLPLSSPSSPSPAGDVRESEGDARLAEPCSFGCWCKAFGANADDSPLRLPFLVDAHRMRMKRQRQELAEAGGLHISPFFRLTPGAAGEREGGNGGEKEAADVNGTDEAARELPQKGGGRRRLQGEGQKACRVFLSWRFRMSRPSSRASRTARRRTDSTSLRRLFRGAPPAGERGAGGRRRDACRGCRGPKPEGCPGS